MSTEEYFNAPGYWHSSDIKSVGQSINHFEKKDQQKVTDGLKDGQGGHTVLLEMENFNDRYTVMPKVDDRTKAGKEQKLLAEEKAHQEGKILVNQEDFTKWLEWKDNIHSDPIISGLFLNNKGENGLWEKRKNGTEDLGPLLNYIKKILIEFLVKKNRMN